jgi:hypothetical protein
MRAFKYAASACVACVGDIRGLLTDKALAEPNFISFISAYTIDSML